LGPKTLTCECLCAFLRKNAWDLKEKSHFFVFIKPPITAVKARSIENLKHRLINGHAYGLEPILHDVEFNIVGIYKYG